jgi:N-formylglutamate deformylase
MPMTELDVRFGDDESPVLIHVPHASTEIPDAVRADIVLDDAGLADELGAMTDAHTDRLALDAARAASTRPWIVVNRLSRLVVDPERFPDDREEMKAVGMGAVYTRTSDGRALRETDPARDAGLIHTYFEPYAQALAEEVGRRVFETGHAVILDLHSYPADPLPYELHADEPRPSVCLGTDSFHTPDWLLALAREHLGRHFDVALNTPFRGTYVPARHYRSDERVSSIMIEIRRDRYTTDDGQLDHLSGGHLSAAIGALADAVTQHLEQQESQRRTAIEEPHAEVARVMERLSAAERERNAATDELRLLGAQLSGQLAPNVGRLVAARHYGIDLFSLHDYGPMIDRRGRRIHVATLRGKPLRVRNTIGRISEDFDEIFAVRLNYDLSPREAIIIPREVALAERGPSGTLSISNRVMGHQDVIHLSACELGYAHLTDGAQIRLLGPDLEVRTPDGTARRLRPLDADYLRFWEHLPSGGREWNPAWGFFPGDDPREPPDAVY